MRCWPSLPFFAAETESLRSTVEWDRFNFAGLGLVSGRFSLFSFCQVQECYIMLLHAAVSVRILFHFVLYASGEFSARARLRYCAFVPGGRASC